MLLLCLSVHFVEAQQTQTRRNLSLTEAIELSLKNSKQIKLNQARITEATASVREAEEDRLPDFKVTGSYIRLNSPNVDLKTKQAGTGSGGSSASYSETKINQAAYGMANLSLPIFAGGRIRYGIESSRYLAEAVKLDADNNRQEVIDNTINAYSNLYKAKASLDLVKENLKQARQRAADFSNLEKNGLMARNDLLKAELQASNVELAQLDAENNWKMANINMDLMIGLPEETELEPDSSAFRQDVNLQPVDVWEQLAFQNRKDIAALNLRKKSADLGVKSAKAEQYPMVALTGGYIAAYIPGMVTLTNAVNLGLGVQYNIGSLWKGSKVDVAKSRIDQVTANEEILNDQVKLSVHKAYQDYLSNQKKIEVLQQAVAQSTENYRITKNKYDNSLATTTDLLDADLAQLQSNINLALARVDAVVSYNKLLQTAGVLETSGQIK